MRAERKLDRQVRLLLIAGCLFWAIGVVVLLFAGSHSDHVLHVVSQMLLGVIVLWVLIGGALMLVLRPHISRLVQAVPMPWQIKFVLLAVLMASIEIGVFTAITSMAPLFGAAVGEAYITPSADYPDMLLFHSVLAFVPSFVIWAWLLKNHRFSTFKVCMIFGITGMLSEALAFGRQSFFNGGFWILVYALMIYLPAATLPEMPERKYPDWVAYVLAVILPILAAIPVTYVLSQIHPVAIHFIQTGPGH